MIERLITEASSYAKDIDGLVLLIGVLVGFWLVVTEAIFFSLIFKFRKRDGVRAQYIAGEQKHEKRWISIPHMLVLVCDVFIVVGAVRVWVEIKQSLPPAEATVRVVTQQWAFSFVQPGPDGKIDTADDIKTVDELHVQVGKTYHYILSSRDVLHDFSVPVFRLKQDAVPGREITGWFKPIKVGRFDIQCAELCGIGHGLMPGKLFVESPAQHAAWVAAHAPITQLAATAGRADR